MQHTVGWPMDVTILLVYRILAVLFTYLLITIIFTYVPGADGDARAYMWSFWWAKRSLFVYHTTHLHSGLWLPIRLYSSIIGTLL